VQIDEARGNDLSEASMILSAGCDLSVPTEVIVSPSISTEPLTTSSWLVPDQPTTTPPSIRILILVSFLPQDLRGKHLERFERLELWNRFFDQQPARSGEPGCHLLSRAARTSRCCSYNATAESSPLLSLLRRGPATPPCRHISRRWRTFRAVNFVGVDVLFEESDLSRTGFVTVVFVQCRNDLLADIQKLRL